MITIVTPYYDRQKQLIRTLLSLQDSKANFEVIIIDDQSNERPSIPEGLNYPVSVLRVDNKVWTNPEPAYNKGIKEALRRGAKKIVLQNPECYHVGDVLKCVENNLTDADYLSFACFSLDKESTELETSQINGCTAVKDGDNAWYNHSIYRPVAYEFCAAITAENMKRLNGYDERLAFGWGRGDAYLRHRIKLLGLNIHIIDDPFVIHQWHYNKTPDNRPALIKKNKRIYKALLKENTFVAKHLITE